MNATDEMGWIDSFSKVTEAVERVQAIRDKLGYKMDIAVDFHGRIHKGMAKVLMKELEPFKLMFVEEPVLTENEEAFVELQRHTTTPIATGRGIMPGGDLKPFLPWWRNIINPIKSWESLKPERLPLWRGYDIAVALHCP